MPPVPPGGYPMPPMPPRPQGGGPNGGRSWWLVGIVAVVAILGVVAGVVGLTDRTAGKPEASSAPGSPAPGSSAPAPAPSVVPPSPQPAPPTKTVGAAQLKRLLLSPKEIVAAIGQPGTAALADPKPVRSKLYIDVISEADCIGMAFNGEKDAYQSSGYDAAQMQTTVARRDKSEPVEWLYDQAVFSFPSAQAAADFVRDSTGIWQRCQGKSWIHQTTDADGEDYQVSWSAGQVGVEGGLMTVWLSQDDSDGWGCRRGLKAEANVVVDFAVCGADVPQAAVTGAAGAITEKITAL